MRCTDKNNTVWVPIIDKSKRQNQELLTVATIMTNRWYEIRNEDIIYILEMGWSSETGYTIIIVYNNRGKLKTEELII